MSGLLWCIPLLLLLLYLVNLFLANFSIIWIHSFTTKPTFHSSSFSSGSMAKESERRSSMVNLSLLQPLLRSPPMKLLPSKQSQSSRSKILQISANTISLTPDLKRVSLVSTPTSLTPAAMSLNPIFHPPL